MKIIANLLQGTPEWLAYRAGHHNASDASALMGYSPYKTRDQLVAERATGITPAVDAATRRRFDEGHRVEALARKIIEDRIGEDLFPVVAESSADPKLSASFDGITLNEETVFECKLWNETKAANLRGDHHVPDADWWQLVQQALASGCKRIIYTISDGTPERTVSLEVSGDELRGFAPQLTAAWAQFDEDVAHYQVQESKPQAVGAAPDQLPALRVEVEGRVLATNLDAFKSSAMAVLGAINRDLQTDDDFADAEKTVKWCKGVEERLDATKANVLAQMQSVDDVCRAIDAVSAETRKVRLELDRLVKAEKENRKMALVRSGADVVAQHYAGTNATLGKYGLPLPADVPARIGQSIKGLKTLTSIQNAVNTEVARIKIDVSQKADAIRENIAVLDGFKDHAALFADAVVLAHTKQPDDLRNLCRARIAEQAKADAERIEAERVRIRAEEQAKVERTERLRQQAINEAERQRQEQAAAMTHDANQAPAELEHFERVGASHFVPADTRTVNLGAINVAIAPLSISAAGLESLGLKPLPESKRAKLYHASDFDAMRDAIIRRLQNASILEKAA